MAYISRALRQLVTERAGGLCEYCHTAQAIVIEMEIDHIVPEVAGGVTEAGNLCLACISCNAFKRDYQTGIDAQTEAEVPLFHPRQQQWHEHFQWDAEGLHIIGTTATGRATVTRLQMNHSIVVQARLQWVQAGWLPLKSHKSRRYPTPRTWARGACSACVAQVMAAGRRVALESYHCPADTPQMSVARTLHSA